MGNGFAGHQEFNDISIYVYLEWKIGFQWYPVSRNVSWIVQTKQISMEKALQIVN